MEFSRASGRQGVNLTPSGRECVLDRYLCMFLPCLIGSRMVDDDVFVRRNRQPDMDFKSGAMAMLAAWSDNGYAASRNPLIVCLQPLDFR